MYTPGHHDYHTHMVECARGQFHDEWRALLRDQHHGGDIHTGSQVTTPSFYDYHEHELLGKWLINLHRYWTAIVDLSLGKSILGTREYSQFLPKIGGAHLFALENLLTLAADHTSTVTTMEVWWELYRWQNEAGAAADPNCIPYLLRPELWPEMDIRVTLAISDGSKPNFDTSGQFPAEIGHKNMNTLWDAACVVEGEGSINSLIAGEFRKLQIDCDCDSDTDVEARVSPEAGAEHPLRSGDIVEDEEMFARVMETPYTERATFTSLMCDNA